MADLLCKDDYGEAEIKPAEDAVKLLTQANANRMKQLPYLAPLPRHYLAPLPHYRAPHYLRSPHGALF